MKKVMITGLAAALLFGCTSGSNTADSTEILLSHTGDAYTDYAASYENRKIPDSYSAAVNSNYTMSYSDDTRDFFILDGVLSVENAGNDPSAHISQYIQANGGNSTIEGDYYGGRLYNTYNGVSYYEDMSLSELKQAMLVPLDPFVYPENVIESIQANDKSDGSVIYTIVLKQDNAQDLFSERYDSYGLNTYDGYIVNTNTITETYDAEGYFIEETALFNVSVTVSEQVVTIDYASTVNIVSPDDNTVTITDDTKTEQKSYVAFENIDTSAISEGEILDDSAEATVTETFKKRLVNRLGYEISDEGYYQISYNDTEAYVIDFDNCTFTYANYSIRYSYSWKGDVGSMGSCTLDFKDDRTSSSCEDSTVEMIRTVKKYLQMELYYCGLSLDDLQAEVE